MDCKHNMEIISNGTTMIWEDDTPILASEVWECTKCGYTDFEEADNMKHYVDDDGVYDEDDIMNQEDELWSSYDNENPSHNHDNAYGDYGYDDYDDDRELDFDN